MHDDKKTNCSRRAFLMMSAYAVSSAGLVTGCTKSDITTVKAATEAQKVGRRTTDSTVAIAKCESYEENVLALLKPYISELGLPDLKNKVVLIKPNLIETFADRPVITNMAITKAAIELADYLGAKEIIIGEGSGNHRDTEFLLESTGYGQMMNKLGLRFVDLNYDDLEKVENKNGFSGIPHMYFPKSVVEADAIFSVPKMKTHHWARMTCSMKNLFGCIPGRKYGWPKNILHFHGIDNCVLDIVRLLKPSVQLVDAVVAMEGDGPMMGTAKHTNLVVLGTDAPATDATCARIMGIPPENVPYIKVAGEAIGNTDEAHIKVLGSALNTVATRFEPAPTFDAQGHWRKTLNSREASS